MHDNKEVGKMANLRTLLLFCVLICLIAPQCASLERLPNGYENAKWGMSTEQIMSKMQYFPNSTCYSSDPRFSTIFAIISDGKGREGITYFFYNNKLFAVSVDYSSPMESVVSELESKYGKPAMSRKSYQDNEGKYLRTTWMDDANAMTFEEFKPVDSKKWQIRINYQSSELRAEIERERKTQKFQLNVKIKKQ